jgi:hypothetical protein
MNNNSDNLCPNKSQGKEMIETISLCRQGLMPLVSSKQILGMDSSSLAIPQKEFFGILFLRGNLRQAKSGTQKKPLHL